MQDNREKNASKRFVEYIDVMNYQLREPVANIFASLPILADNINKSSTEASMENANAIYKRAYSIMKCVDNLSMVSRLQSGYKYSKEILDFSQLVKNLFSSAQVVLPEYVFLEYEVSDNCVIEGSKYLLSVAILNILLNSLEYCQEDVYVSVKLKKEEKKCVLTYRDNSKGIKPEIIENVFEIFYSKDPYNDGEITNKMGLGLYIAQQAVSHAGGTIFIESEFGKGVNVIVSLPLCEESSELVFKSRTKDFVLNKYSELYVQLCGFCELPDLT